MMLDLHGVFADDKVAEIFDARHCSLSFALERAFSPSHESLICFELDKDVGPIRIGCKGNAKYFNVGNFQAGTEIAKCVGAGSLLPT
jgi:hypothetical protein